MMSNSPEPPQLTRRQKHRRQVKRYEQRRKNLEARVSSEERDTNLFLFAGMRSGARGRPLWLQQHCAQYATRMSAAPFAAPLWHEDSYGIAFDLHAKRDDATALDTLETSSDSSCTLEAALVAPSFYAEACDQLDVDGCPDDQGTARLLSAMEVSCPSRAPGNTTNISSIHVRRVEGVPAIPVAAPLAPGTDLNLPTRNYLTMDAVHNVHQHAPGFERDGIIALRSMLDNAVSEWKEVKDRVPILSTGATMQALFEQMYSTDKPLALQVRRLGPALVIDVHSDIPTSVQEMHNKALFGKTLYRLEEEAGQPERSAAGDGVPRGSCKGEGGGKASGEEGEEEGVSESESRALVFPVSRVGSGAVTRQVAAMNRYSQILRWDIDSLEVLVGVDTPVVLDHRSNTEQMLKLEDAAESHSLAEIQRENLGCWFEAMLANVPQVGIYVHKAGVVQSFEVKKVQELLGLVEGRIATAALNFTSNVLQWIVSNCVKDQRSYAVIRGYGSDYLELFELPESCKVPKEEGLEEMSEPPGSSTTSNTATTTSSDTAKRVANGKGSAPTNAQMHQSCEEAKRLRLRLAQLRYGMAEHLFKEGNPERADEAMCLLLNSFTFFIEQSRSTSSTERLHDIVQMLPALVTRNIISYKSTEKYCGAAGESACASGLGSKAEPHPLPDGDGEAACGYRRSFVLCRRFVELLRRAVEDGTVTPTAHATYVHCLIPCSAALCVVMSRTLENCGSYRQDYWARGTRTLKRGAAGSQSGGCVYNTATAGGTLTEQTKRTLSWTGVVIEGLTLLEGLVTAIERHSTGSSNNSNTATRGDGVAASHAEDPLQRQSSSALVDPSTAVEIDVEPLRAALCELYGDVVLLTMADPTPFTAETVSTLSRSLSAKNKSSGTTKCPGTTLDWLSAITPDIVSLSFTALRFYTKAGTRCERHLLKTAQTYYYVGQHYHKTDRFTKALEALHRARSLFEASVKAPKDTVFGGCFISTDMVLMSDVQYALGCVYMSVASLKARSNTNAAVKVTKHQPLSVGPTHSMDEEDERFLRQALHAFTEAGCALAATERARTLTQHVSAIADAAVLKGSPLDGAGSLHLWQMLQEAGKTDTTSAERWCREWELLRVVTCTAAGQHHPALLKEAEAVMGRWSSPEQSVAPCAYASPLFPIHTVERNLQLALTCCVMAEGLVSGSGKQKASLRFPLQQWARKTAAYIACGSESLTSLAPAERAAQFRLAAAAWGAACAEAWAYRVASMIALRVLLAVMRVATGKIHTQAGQVFAAALALEEAGGPASGSVQSSAQLGQLHKLATILEPLLAW